MRWLRSTRALACWLESARSPLTSSAICRHCAGRAHSTTSRVWAIEDCRHVSRRLELALVAAGERVVRVAPQLMGQSRQGERQPGKSDQIDALAVARAVVREGVERFPSALPTSAR